MNNNLTRRGFLGSALSVIGISMLPTGYRTMARKEIGIVGDEDVQIRKAQLPKWCYEEFWIDVFNRDMDEAWYASEAMIDAYLLPNPNVLARAWGKNRETDTRAFLHDVIPGLTFAEARAVATLVRSLQLAK